ncbi:MAG: C25 family cysteine peptidase [Bacteroidota bacterium]
MKHSKAFKIFFYILLTISTSNIFGTEIHLKDKSQNTLKVLDNTYQKLKVDFVLNDLISREVMTERGIFNELTVDNFSSRTQIGEPKLPVSRSLIEIPVGAEPEVKILVSTYTEYSLSELGITYPIIPTQAPQRKSAVKPNPFVINQKVYLKNAFIQDELVSLDQLGIMRGSRLGRLNISAIQYNPKSGKIRIYDKIKFEIIFKHPDIPATILLMQKNSSPYFLELGNQLLNAKMASATESNLTHYPVTYVIVSSPTFQGALQPFIAWKIKKGFKVIEAYTDNPLVGNTTTSIKSYLQNLYNQGTVENPSFSYVLLVGDVAEIPSFAGTTGTHMSDLYYAEYTGDILPEVFIGRFSATNESELQPQISKTLEYEQYLMPDPSFLNQVVMIAGVDPNYGPLHANGQINYGTDNYFNLAHNITSHTYLYPASGSSAALIIQNVSDGVGFANYTAHGSPNGWADPGFSVSDVATLQNDHKYPLMIGNCCQTNAFDSPVCFGEALLRASNKGAIGYIGASDYSYWDEDYYWGIGARTITANPVWAAGPLGSYDRLFHDHGEQFPEWFTTQGQMVVAGNLAVTEGSPGSASYYWEIYHLMGDPSLMPYLTVPAAITATFNSMMPLASPSFTVNTIPYAYAALSRNGILYGAALADSNGLCNIPLQPVLSPGYISLVITAQNHHPFIDSILTITPTGPYVLMSNYQVHETLGNSNGEIDFNEQGDIDMSLKNWGLSNANPVSATISSLDAYVTITDNSENWGLISTNAEINKPAAFAFSVANNIPDQHKIPFTITITDGVNTWNSYLLVNVNAPKFVIHNMTFSDLANGNGDGVIDPGETIQVLIETKNEGHADAPGSIGDIISLGSLASILNTSVSLNTLNSSSSVIASFTATVSASAVNGDNLLLDYTVTSGQYNAMKSFNLVVGKITENWESGDFSHFNWQAPGPNPWFITTLSPFEGLYCSQSGAIADLQTTELTLSASVLMQDSISFHYKVSSENTYDFLRFYINGSMQDEWSGEKAWSRTAYFVQPGTATFKWAYEKDQSEFAGLDASWIDMVDFPPMAAIITSNQELPSALNGVQLYPNPARDHSSLVFYLEKAQVVTMRIYNALGQEVSVFLNNTSLTGGSHTYSFNTSEMAKGMYYIKFTCNGNTVTSKLIVD